MDSITYSIGSATFQKIGGEVMRYLWQTWFKVLWKDYYLWGYYCIALTLFASHSLFQIQEQHAMIPFYGLLISLLTIMILQLHQSFKMDKLIRVAISQPLLFGFQLLIFCLICALPTLTLLTIEVSLLFPDTPFILVLNCVALLTLFAIAIGCSSSLLTTNLAVGIIVALYFSLFLLHGYQLERLTYLAPTLNFMYPDYPNPWNSLAIIVLSLFLIGFYFNKHYDFTARDRNRLRSVLLSLLCIYALIPIVASYTEKKASTEQILVENKLAVTFTGVSATQALRYGQAVLSTVSVLQQAGIDAVVTDVTVIWQHELPKGKNIENIIEQQGTTLVIRPYSRKFFEFNYGYHIVRDITALFVHDETEARTIERHVIQKNQYHLFTPAKIKRASPQ